MQGVKTLFYILTFFCLYSCDRSGEETTDPVVGGYVEYTVNGINYRFEDLGINVSVSSSYVSGDLDAIGFTAGTGVNTILFSDYSTTSEGTITINNDALENEDFIGTLNLESDLYSMFWGSGLGVTTGEGTITYTVFDPQELPGQTHLEGTFSFTMYSLLAEEILVTGSFSF